MVARLVTSVFSGVGPPEIFCGCPVVTWKTWRSRRRWSEKRFFVPWLPNYCYEAEATEWIGWSYLSHQTWHERKNEAEVTTEKKHCHSGRECTKGSLMTPKVKMDDVDPCELFWFPCGLASIEDVWKKHLPFEWSNMYHRNGKSSAFVGYNHILFDFRVISAASYVAFWWHANDGRPFKLSQDEDLSPAPPAISEVQLDEKHIFPCIFWRRASTDASGVVLVSSFLYQSLLLWWFAFLVISALPTHKISPKAKVLLLFPKGLNKTTICPDEWRLSPTQRA